jgi:predicted secreted protein
MKAQRTVITAMINTIRFRLIRAKSPIVLSVKRDVCNISFKRFNDIQSGLSNLADMKIMSSPIKLNMKLKAKINRKISVERIDYRLLFKKQSEMFEELLEETKPEIKRRLMMKQGELG